jgi:tRNA pseudouridine38-40 synthase
MSRRIKLTVSYDGTGYHGWQVQPGLPTVQAILEAVFSEIEGAPVQVAGSGRTDAGVHAEAQVAAVSLSNRIPLPNLRKAVNRLLPPEIRLLECSEVHPGFHPRFDAVSKTYEYRIFREEICPPFERRYVHHYPYPIDEQCFVQAAPVYTGERDFSAFAAADERDARGYSKVRTIFHSAASREGNRLIYRVRGSGFLKHMVRNMVGVLLECAKGNISPSAIEERLRPGCPVRSGPTAPASGLFLIEVDYDRVR